VKPQHTDHSLSEVHASIDPSIRKGKWRKIVAFFGPAYLVSVGYMDPGNWATDIAGGSSFGYQLIWVLLLSNFMALLLQTLSAKLGIVRGHDLAQCTREEYPRTLNFVLYLLAEVAIAACDLAEVLGIAIALNLLFKLPMLYGVVLTALDTILLLYLQQLGMRKLESFIITLIAVIGGCFFIEMFFAKPHLGEVIKGFAPVLPNREALYIAIGIIGATVMPHNLYLHSALVQTRLINRDDRSLWKATRFNFLDSFIALNAAFFVNAAILILAASVFYFSGNRGVASLQDAYKLLTPLLGNKWAALLFGVALLAAGQSSTITGTLAGQVVMEGYLRLRISPALRRLITRSLAIIPTVVILVIVGDSMVEKLLIFSQVLLSMQLSFAVIPLILFVSNKQKMGVHAIKTPLKIVSWLTAALIVYLNMNLFMESAGDWMKATHNFWLQALVVALVACVIVLLAITLLYPLIKKVQARGVLVHRTITQETMQPHAIRPFNKVALALDFSEKDDHVLRYALQLGHPTTEFILIHVVESVSAQVLKSDALDYETRQDKAHLDEYTIFLSNKGYKATSILGFKNRVREIARIVNETNCDILVIGSHGHTGIKDWVFGETINSVRHLISVPVFIAR
jgi:manganese transport protein